MKQKVKNKKNTGKLCLKFDRSIHIRGEFIRLDVSLQSRKANEFAPTYDRHSLKNMNVKCKAVWSVPSYFLTTLPVKHNVLLDGQVTDQTTASDNSHLNNTEQASDQVTPQVTPQVKKLLLVLQGDMSRSEIMQVLTLEDRKNLREKYLVPAIEAGLVELTIPDKPKSSQQKYRLTALGKIVKKAQND